MNPPYFLVVISLSLAIRTTAQIRPSPTPSGSPSIGNCAVFPSDNIWNTPVDKLPLDPNSQAYVQSIGADKPMRPDFGSGTYQGAPIGIPFVTVPANQKRVRITFDYRGESDLSNYPIPSNPPIEGGPSPRATGTC